MKPSPKISLAALWLLLTTLAGSVQAQQTVSLDSALQLASKNNKNLQATMLEQDYYRYQKGTSTRLPKMDVSLMYGQYNSYYMDNNLTVSQTIPFPTLFAARHALAGAQVKGAELKAYATRNELNYQVKQAYYTLLYLNARIHLLRSQDSLYTRMAAAAALRFKTGDGTLLTRASAETRLNEVRNILQQALAEREIYKSALQSLLGLSEPLEPVSQEFAARQPKFRSDSIAPGSNPFLAWTKQQIDISEKEKSVSVNGTLPEFKLGYFNQTLYGSPLNEASTSYAGAANRFQGVQFGVILPLWFVPEIHQARASQAQVNITRKQYESEELRYKNLYTQAYQNYLKAQANLQYFQVSGLPNAILLSRQSELAYAKGEIGYAEYVLTMQQASSLRESYLLAMHEYNQAVIYMEFLTASN